MSRMLVRAAIIVASLMAVAYGQGGQQNWGFVGMRGKKEAADMEDYKGAGLQQGLMQQGLMQQGPLAAQQQADMDFIDEYKRAPSVMAFQGVRGKKDGIMDKRTPSMGFMGMRGKKDMDYPWLMDAEDKRGPSGFFGMRGKKGPSNSGFFGMRGKKGPSNSGFFGMRGKKGPSGFMGVRGKKNGPEDIDELIQMLRESAARQEMEDMVESRAKRFASFAEGEDHQQFGADLLQ